MHTSSPDADSPPRLGVLIECDPSIKSIIVNIDSARHDYIIEDLDDQRVVVKENMVGELKRRLEEVRLPACASHATPAAMELTDSIEVGRDTAARRRIGIRVNTTTNYIYPFSPNIVLGLESPAGDMI